MSVFRGVSSMISFFHLCYPVLGYWFAWLHTFALRALQCPGPGCVVRFGISVDDNDNIKPGRITMKPGSKSLSLWVMQLFPPLIMEVEKWLYLVSETVGGTHFPLPWLMGGRVVRFDELTKWMLHSRWFREANYRTERLGQRMSGAVKEFGNVICCVLVGVDIQ